MLMYSRQIVDCLGDRSDKSKDIVTRYISLSEPYGKKAQWILITDAFYQPIGTCMVGDGAKHHFVVDPKWRNIGFERKIEEMAQAIIEHS